jgi:hypothetical protein
MISIAQVLAIQENNREIICFGVFNDSEEANTHTEFLHESGLKVANLENISTALNSIKAQSVAI